jgi:hypothetical protein
MLYLPPADPLVRIHRLTRWHRWFAWRPVQVDGRWVWLRRVRRRLQAPCALLPWRRDTRYAPCAGGGAADPAPVPRAAPWGAAARGTGASSENLMD